MGITPCLCPQPQTPHLEEDLKEVLRSEAGIELIIEDDVRPEKQKKKSGVSGYGLETLTSAWAVCIVRFEGRKTHEVSRVRLPERILAFYLALPVL